MDKKNKIILGSALLLIAVAAFVIMALCGKKQPVSENIDIAGLQSRVTAVDTEIASIYGKVADMHQKGTVNDELYFAFNEIDNRADELMEAVQSGNVTEQTQNDITALETDFADFKAKLEEIEALSDSTLSTDILSVSRAAEDLDRLMQRKLQSGDITRQDYDDFLSVKEKAVNYVSDSDIVFDEAFKEDFENTRQQLAAFASKAGADNALIGRILGDKSAPEAGEENTAEQTTADVTAAPGETQKEAETETEAAKNPLPQEDIDLNNAYLALQDFAMKKLENKELAEADVMQLMNIGVDLAYLKEAIELDGYTENNQFTLADIKSRLYDKAVELGYEDPEVFK